MRIRRKYPERTDRPGVFFCRNYIQDSNGQLGRGYLPRTYQSSDGREAAADVPLCIDQYADARNVDRSSSGARRVLFPSGRGDESDQGSVLGLYPFVYADAARRRERGWLDAMLVRVRVRKRGHRETYHGGPAMCPEPAVQSNTPFSAVDPPSEALYEEKSPTISTYHAEDLRTLDSFFRLHRRPATRRYPAYRGSILLKPPDRTIIRLQRAKSPQCRPSW